MQQVPTIRYDSAEEPAGQVERRFDALPADDLAKAQRTTHGFLKLDARIAKPGVIEYVDGREYLSPEVLFRADTLEACSMLPATLEHPLGGGHMVTPDDAMQFAIGHSGQARESGGYLRAQILITDKDAIKAVGAGVDKVSLGYDAYVIKRPGEIVHDDGRIERFDSVRTKVLGNHIALTRASRVGPDIRARTDSKMAKIKINDTEIEVPENVIAHFDAQAIKIKAERDVALGKIDVLTSEAKTRTDAASSQAAKEQRAKEQLDHLTLVAQALPILELDIAKVVRMDSSEIRREVVRKAEPTFDLAGKNDDRILGMYEVIVAKRTDSATDLNALLGARVPRTDGGGAPITDLAKAAAAAKAKADKERAEAWQTKSA